MKPPGSYKSIEDVEDRIRELAHMGYSREAEAESQGLNRMLDFHAQRASQQVIDCYQEYDWRTRRTYLNPEHTHWVMNVGDTFDYDPELDGDES